MKKKVFFVQTGCVCNNEYYLPYATGLLAAYAFANPVIQANYSLGDLFYKCDDISVLEERIDQPDVVAFSNYMWNYSFNLKLASGLKKKHPGVIIVFGGHQINEADHILEKYPFIDFLIFGEGEVVFTDLLLSLVGVGNKENIHNIAFRDGNVIRTTAKAIINKDINSFPSPYVTGVFDKIIKNSTDRFAAVLETSRGCPYHCSYCDWGDYNNKIRKFSLARVFKEIEWLGKHSISYFVIADSNFGFFHEDEKIIDKIIETRNKYGFPQGLTVAFQKNSTEQIFRMNQKLYEHSLSRGATLSMQTLSAEALKNIHRENMPASRFVELMKLYNKNHIPAYTELILGLPGETYESFCEGINYLLENGQHNFIHVFLCELLPNSEMNTEEYKKKYKIQSVQRKFVMRAGQKNIGTEGVSTIVVGTYSMSKQEMLKSLVFSFVIEVFHNYGLLRFFALYLFDQFGVTYKKFYETLVVWLKNRPDSESGKIFERFVDFYRKCLNGENSDTYFNPVFGDVEFNLPDGAFLELQMISTHFYQEMKSFLRHFGLPDEIEDELLRFQIAVINSPEIPKRTEVFHFNWIEYFFQIISNRTPELKCSAKYELVLSSPYTGSLSEYIENVIIKGRRTGESLLINNPARYTIL